MRAFRQVDSAVLECEFCNRSSSLRAGNNCANENAHELDRGQLQKISISLAD